MKALFCSASHCCTAAVSRSPNKQGTWCSCVYQVPLPRSFSCGGGLAFSVSFGTVYCVLSPYVGYVRLGRSHVRAHINRSNQSFDQTNRSHQSIDRIHLKQLAAWGEAYRSRAGAVEQTRPGSDEYQRILLTE